MRWRIGFPNERGETDTLQSLGFVEHRGGGGIPMVPARWPAEIGSVVVTGASSGIGYELCKLFARDGFPLLLTARNGERLRAVAAELTAAHGIAVATCAADLTDPEAPGEIFAAAQQLPRPVQILVNNAGFGSYGPFVEADLEPTLQMLQVNIVA